MPASIRSREALIRDTVAFVVFELMIIAAGWRFYVDGSELLFPVLLLQGYVAGSFSDNLLARFFPLGPSERAEDVLRDRGERGKLSPDEAWELLQGVLADHLERAGVRDEIESEVKESDTLSEDEIEEIIHRVKSALAEDAIADLYKDRDEDDDSLEKREQKDRAKHAIRKRKARGTRRDGASLG